LFLRIGNHFEYKNCKVYQSPFDVRLFKNIEQQDKAITTVVQPDICVICDLEKLDDRGCVGAPDLIVEVLSPSTLKKDYNEKFNLYEENEVKEYWLANPEGKSIEIFHLDKGEYHKYDFLNTRRKSLLLNYFLN